jgi:hypothetical protein
MGSAGAQMTTTIDGDFAATDAASLELRQLVEKALLRHERIRWIGRPYQGFRLRQGDLVGVPVSIMWLGFALFWEVSVITAGAPAFAWMFGAAFVAIGAYMLGGRFLYARYINRRTVYAVTNQRVLSFVRGRNGNAVLAFRIDQIHGVYTRSSSRGRGVVSFGAPLSFSDGVSGNGFGVRRGSRGRPSSDLAFHDVSDPDAVARLVADTDDG